MGITRTITLPGLMSIRLQIHVFGESTTDWRIVYISCFGAGCWFTRAFSFFFTSIFPFLRHIHSLFFFLGRIMSAMYGTGCGHAFLGFGYPIMTFHEIQRI
jgi:hypothetical protein